MDMIQVLSSKESNPLDGMFSGAGGIVGIVLIVTGLLLIYIAVKVMKGYSFMPTFGAETIIEEDNYVEGEAKLLQKTKTVLPDLGSGEEREFIEWEISYTAGGKDYTQMIPDDGYEKGDILKIKYDPEKPEAYYLVDDTEEDRDDEPISDDAGKSRNTGIILIVLGILTIVGGAALVLM